MMSYDKYEKEWQNLKGGHQRITIKKYIIKIKILTLWLIQSNQWLGIDHAARIQLLNFPPMTGGSVDKNKMVVMMTMMI